MTGSVSDMDPDLRDPIESSTIVTRLGRLARKQLLFLLLFTRSRPKESSGEVSNLIPNFRDAVRCPTASYRGQSWPLTRLLFWTTPENAEDNAKWLNLCIRRQACDCICGRICVKALDGGHWWPQQTYTPVADVSSPVGGHTRAVYLLEY